MVIALFVGMVVVAVGWVGSLCLGAHVHHLRNTSAVGQIVCHVAAWARRIDQSMSKFVLLGLIVNALVVGVVLENGVILMLLQSEHSISGDEIVFQGFNFLEMALEIGSFEQGCPTGTYSYKPSLFTGHGWELNQSLMSIACCE